eukprot:6205185-Pleurochrysis_carterae.AAC.1
MDAIDTDADSGSDRVTCPAYLEPTTMPLHPLHQLASTWHLLLALDISAWYLDQQCRARHIATKVTRPRPSTAVLD